jgi:hypothetical protein
LLEGLNAQAGHEILQMPQFRYSQAVNFVGRERTQLSYVLVQPQPGVSAMLGDSTGILRKSRSEELT